MKADNFTENPRAGCPARHSSALAANHGASAVRRLPRRLRFGKFSVRHKPGILRRIPFTGKTILTKDRRKVTFVSLGRLRQLERVN